MCKSMGYVSVRPNGRCAFVQVNGHHVPVSLGCVASDDAAPIDVCKPAMTHAV